MAELNLTTANFETEVLKSKTPVLVDFYAQWCPPCRLLAPILEELVEELKGKIKIGKLDVDKNQSIASQYGVMSIPTLILFKNGKEEKRIIGLRTKEELKRELT